MTPTAFGKFVARFEEVPPPFPSEYLIPLYGIIVSSIVGWSIPSIVSWSRSKKEGRRLYSIHKEINRIFDDGKVDHGDTESLDKVKIIIENAYSKGDINSEHYTQLNDQISVLYHEIYKKLIDSLKPDQNDMSLAKIREEVEDAYAKRKLNDLHYTLLDKKLKSIENSTIQQSSDQM